MITSKNIIKISEEWVKTGISEFTDDAFDLYINPGSSDYLDMMKTAREDSRKFQGIRFVASNSLKKVFVADGLISTHYDIERVAGIPSGTRNGTQIEGLADIVGGRAKMKDFYDSGHLDKFQAIDWKWVDKYISGCSAYIGDGSPYRLK